MNANDDKRIADPVVANSATTAEMPPRTNEVVQSIGKSGVDWHHSASLMRKHAEQLEREITALEAKLAEAEKDKVAFTAACKSNGITDAEQADLPRLFRWMSESLASFRSKFSAASNLQALDAIDTMQSELSTLRRQVGEAKRDTGRLDFCETSMQKSEVFRGSSNPFVVWFTGFSVAAPTFREAIDERMQHDARV